MKIKFLGAAGTVTGSSYVLTSGSGQSILIDLGMFQGLPDVEQLNYQPYDFDCSRLIGAVLTHAHLDHCGRLPIILPKGFTGKIWMTPPTRDLTELSLFDTAKIAKEDEKPFLFDKKLVTQTIEQFQTVEYRTPFQIGDFTITMRDAGHILGSASLEIIDTQPNSEVKKIVFSGDLGNSPEPLLEPTELIDSADAVVMESTYGDRMHPEVDAVETILSEIHSIENNNGTLLIPAFSLERTQELLHMIMHLKKTKKIKANTSIFLDSPMGNKATQIYMNYPRIFNSHVQDDLKIGSPFEFPGLEVVPGWQESQAISHLRGPKVIIAGSGMMTGGRIVSHAARFLSQKSTRLLIVGYQGEGTLGRQLSEGMKNVVIKKMPVHVKAAVNTTRSMSSHADQRQLIDWLTHIKNVKKVFLTHGENEPRAALAKRITDELGIGSVELPILNQEIGF
jgi:metallo-beta-lactamase family protein